MKKKIFVFLLIIALILSSFIINSSAKELDSIAEIAAISKLEPVGSEKLNAYTELSEVKAGSLPSSYSSRDLGHTTPVRQQSANICWAYGSLACLETLLMKSGETVKHFSPEHMNVWGSTEDTGLGWQRDDLNLDGGYSYIPMGYLTSWNGPLFDSQLPYGSVSHTASTPPYDKTAYFDANAKYSVGYGVTGIKYINRETPIETVKSYIMDYGAVLANFNADTVNYLNKSSDGFYCSDGSLATNELYGHAVSVVGWNDDYPKENFSTSYSGDTPINNGAWLIKNSWGDRVNNNGGYFWVSYEDAWIFHSIFGPSFAISDYEKLDGSKEIYQNEIYGATAQFSYLTDESIVPADAITYINVFDFNGKDSELDQVVFESTSFGADYTAYYIPVFGDKPTSESALWTELGSGVVDYTGYLSVDTNDFTLPEGKGAIGITIDNTKTYNENKNNANYEYIPNSLGVCEWLAFKGGYYFKNQGEKGDSFVMYKEFGQTQTYDLMDLYTEFFDDSMGATFVIKAITNNPEFTPEPTTSQPDTLPSESTTQPNTISLGITLNYLGNNKLTVIASATGGSGDYEYEFYCNDQILKSYSNEDSCSILFDTDGIYMIKVSAKDNGGRVITTQSAVEVRDGRVVKPGETTPAGPTTTVTEPTETTQPTETATAPKNVKAYIIGDTDHNNSIGIKDATLIRKHLAKITEFDAVTLTLADVDASGGCTIKDATLIQKYIALIDAPSNVGKTVMLYE
ncbi:MAG: hypothetical protein IJW04_01475 [Ruminococcus sp.]|nr:hypothetical protein [Ruminococcus sp.]